MTARWDTVLRDVLEEARRLAGGGAALATALRAASVGPESGTYSESAVSNWIKGRARPPADVVLAAAALYGLSLDTRLGLEPEASTTEPSDIDALRAEVNRLATLVHEHLSGPVSAPTFSTKDVRGVFATRSEVLAAMPVLRTLANAARADAMGLSLNMLCQGVSDVTLAELIENGLVLRCLFLDPDGAAIIAREEEEGLPKGHLADLTRANMMVLERTIERLSPEARERAQVRAYDEPLRFNITTVDRSRSLVQPYLPNLRGLDAPTLLIEVDDDEPHGLFPTFERIFDGTWERARVIAG